MPAVRSGGASVKLRLLNLLSFRFWSLGERPWYGSLAASTFVHLCLIAVLGWLLTRGDTIEPTPELDSRWQDTGPTVELTELPANSRPEATLSTEAGGVQSPALTRQRRVGTAVRVRRPSIVRAVRRPDADRALANDQLAAVVGEYTGASGDGSGDGTGDGSGSGSGVQSAAGFFGQKAKGKSVVFVVDCSGSMNHPHPGKWKTRFRRLKSEILKSVAAMDDSQRFFIIYFNDECFPMIPWPRSRMQPARGAYAGRYLEWMSRQRAIGQTDPRSALYLALKLAPEEIYFLTDGSFTHKVERELKKLRQNRSVIHTFAFGSLAGEPVMKHIARNNGGKYFYIP